MSLSKSKTVILWVHPRSTSTMFECALLTRPDEIRVLHEPMGDAWYFGPEKQSKRYSDEECQNEFKQFEDSSYEKTWNNIVTPVPDPEDDSKSTPLITFSKDMASYIFPLSPSSAHSAVIPSSFASAESKSSAINPTLIPTDILLDPSIVHTFLIRHPAKAIPSYKRLCYPGSPTGFNYFDPAEAGYKELRILFDFIRENKPEENILVMESEELLEDPERVMKGWCETVGIEFDPGMLQWEEGTREHFVKWPGWHSSAENSSGINKGLTPEHCTLSNHASTTFSTASPSSSMNDISAHSDAGTGTSSTDNNSLSQSDAASVGTNNTSILATSTLPVVQEDRKPSEPQTDRAHSQEVWECIEESMEDYEYLKSFVVPGVKEVSAEK